MRPDILTSKGTYFDFTKPGDCEIDIRAIAHALANICRFGGHVRTFYSVAQHSVVASYLVPEEHAFAALMHDAAEAYVGDVPAPLKQLLPDYREIERRVEAAVFARYGITTPLDPVVKVADKVLLLAEQRALMPAHSDLWEGEGELTTPPGLVERIIPWPPALAEAHFLNRFFELAAG